MNSGKCEVCNVDVHRASHVKHLSKKHLENIKQNERNDNTRMVVSRTC